MRWRKKAKPDVAFGVNEVEQARLGIDMKFDVFRLKDAKTCAVGDLL